MSVDTHQLIQVATVVANDEVCRAHLRLTLRVAELPAARPGQFVHLRPANGNATTGRGDWSATGPLLRRAFSVAGLRRAPDHVSLDVVYRVVGKGTRWLAGLRAGDEVSLLGPVGNSFPLSESKPRAWLVAGGVGLPPMLWLAEVARQAGKEVVALCGAQTRELLPLTLDDNQPPDAKAHVAQLSANELARYGVPVVVSTDDGSCGFAGHVGLALQAYAEANSVRANDLVVYTCGPEPMLRVVAEFCAVRGIECHVCMERAMACGTGLCQSCVVPVRDETDGEGWRYALCCREGPVFDAKDVIWEDPQTR